MRVTALFAAFLLACTPVVEPIPRGTILCEVEADCDDDNDCTEDACEGGRCRFFAEEDGAACLDDDGHEGACNDGACR